MVARNENPKSLKIAKDENASLSDFYPNQLNFIFDIADLLERKISETDAPKEEE